MGVDNDVKVIFGVEYSYDELENFRKHKGTIDYASEIGTSNLICIWSELHDSILSKSLACFSIF
jgi:hypothetical protein